MIIGQNSSYLLGKKMLDTSALRQEVISHNIANVNTQGYKAKQVQFEGELRKALDKDNISLKATEERHFGVRSDFSNLEAEVVETAENTKMNLDENNVDIDLEMANMAANQIQYSTMVRQVSEQLNNYKYVIRGN